MKYFILIVLFTFTLCGLPPQADTLVKLHDVPSADMSAVASPVLGSLIYNTSDDKVYVYSSSGWVPIHSASDSNSYTINVQGRAYIRTDNRWYSPHPYYGTGSQNWSFQQGDNALPTYSVSSVAGIAIPANTQLKSLTIKNQFSNANSQEQYINLSILRNGSFLNIGTYALTGGSTSIIMQSIDTPYVLLKNDLLVWALRRVGGSTRYNYCSMSFHFE